MQQNIGRELVGIYPLVSCPPLLKMGLWIALRPSTVNLSCKFSASAGLFWVKRGGMMAFDTEVELYEYKLD